MSAKNTLEGENKKREFSIQLRVENAQNKNTKLMIQTLSERLLLKSSFSVAGVTKL